MKRPKKTTSAEVGSLNDFADAVRGLLDLDPLLRHRPGGVSGVRQRVTVEAEDMRRFHRDPIAWDDVTGMGQTRVRGQV